MSKSDFNSEFIKNLNGSLDKRTFMNRINNIKNEKEKNALCELWLHVSENSDNKVDINEITVFVNRLLEEDKKGNNNGTIDNKEIKNYIKDTRTNYDLSGLSENVKVETVKEFLEIFAQFSNKHDKTSVKTNNEDGSYSTYIEEEHRGNKFYNPTSNSISKIIKRKKNYDNDNNLISIEETDGNKTTVKNPKGEIIKVITIDSWKATRTEEVFEQGSLIEKYNYKFDKLLTRENFQKGKRTGTDYFGEDGSMVCTSKVFGHAEQFYQVKDGVVSDKIDYRVEYDDTPKIMTKYEYENGILVNKYTYDNHSVVSQCTKYKDGKEVTSIDMLANRNTSHKVIDEIDGVIDDFNQNNEVGDCWLIAGLQTLSQTTWGRQAIKDSIKEDSDGNITVHLEGAYGSKKDFTVTYKEIAEAIDNNTMASGDRDIIAFEIAIEKYRNQYNEKIDDGGRFEEISRLILGKNRPFSLLTNSGEYISALNQFKNNPDKYAIYASFELEDQYHAYTVKRIEKDSKGKEYVIFSNPWNSRAEIKMSKSEFVQKVDTISVVTRPEKYKDYYAKELFSDSQIGDFKMGTKVNNTGILSVIKGLYATPDGKELLQDIIKKDNLGNIVINFPGKNYPITITKQDINTAQASGYFSTGDDDVTALEIAIDRFYNKDNNNTLEELEHKDISDMSIDEIMNLLTGDTFEGRSKSSWDNSLEYIDTNPNYYRDYVIIANKYVRDGDLYHVQTNHCLIKRVEKNALGQTIIVVTQPEDTSVEIKYTVEEFKSWDMKIFKKKDKRTYILSI